MHVADFGSGKTGAFVFPAAKIVGESGSVFAVDIMKESLAGLAKRAAQGNFHNFHTVWADVERPNAVAIPPATLDAALLINFLSAVKQRDAVFGEANRLLKSGGSILVVDWKNRLLSYAPPTEDMVNTDTVKQWASANGYTVTKEFDADKYHWGLVLQKT
jgi:ubiquinone/menaquinone biosynthesis C-methylase UbiE